ncbi:MAG: single-stranded-DNA-specific exonuclease RecJ [Chloroflexota bacterium]
MKLPNIERIWQDPAEIAVPAEIYHLAGENLLLAKTLVRRGMVTFDQARAYLNPDFYQPADANDLPDMEKGVELVKTALQKGIPIGVWGDFDVDGQTATTVLVSTLRNLGGQVSYHIPIRATESHGVNIAGLQSMIEQGARLILTCDTGISALPAADYLRQRGVPLVITDHHSLPPVLPAAHAVINPQRLPASHPLHTLPGAGTAYLFAQALCQSLGKAEQAEQHLDLVALGTIADLAILRGDARYLAQRGLESLRQPRRALLVQLLENAEINPAHLNEQHISFSIAPRLNAIGRLGDANPVVEFLLATERERTAVFAAQLEGYNSERRFLTEQVFQAALQQIENDANILKYAVLVLHHPHWPAGINGIVASRIVETFQRPAILLSAPAGEPMRGSARSVEGINITAAIASAADILIGFGGHPMAAGLALDGQNLTEFRRRVSHHVERQRVETRQQSVITIDAWLDLAELNLEMVQDMERLAPFGPGNPPLVFASQNLKLLEASPIGKTQEHLMMVVEDEHGFSRRVIWWQGARRMLPEGRFDLAYHARAVNFGGDLEVQLEWILARMLEEPVISLHTAAPVEITDWREQDSLDDLLPSEINTSSGILIWADGSIDSPLPVRPRWALSPAHTLVILQPPPSMEILRHALRMVQPKRIILCAAATGAETHLNFLERLSGMVRFVITKRSGLIEICKLAAALNQRETLVQAGIEWLAARGFIRILEETTQKVQVAEGGVPNETAASKAEARVESILEETLAFRQFYRRTDAGSIIAAARD